MIKNEGIGAIMERIYTILELLKIKKQISIQELCQQLYCSPATIRRDIKKLEDMSAAKKIRGGIILLEGTNFDYSANYRTSVNLKEKEYICNIASLFIKSGMSVFIDSSSTAMCICPLLSQKKNITVVTNGLDTALLLNECDSIDTHITGGHLKKGTHTVLGETTCSSINEFKADLALISCRGIDCGGAYEADISQKSIKRHMMSNAKKTVLLCDSSKFGTSFFHKLTEFNELEAVITDKKPSDDLIKAVTDAGSEVLF